MQAINHNNEGTWDYNRTGIAINQKKNEWIRNIPTWLLNLLPVIMLKQETVQTFGANHTLKADIPAECLKENVDDAIQSRGEVDALGLLSRTAYDKTTITPVYRTSYQVNGQEISSTAEHFRYSHLQGYTGGEKSLRDTQGFKDRFDRSIMLFEENPFNHNGIGPGTDTASYRSSNPDIPYNRSLLDGDLTNLPQEVASQNIVTRSRVGLVLDGNRALRMAAVVGLIATAALMAYYRS